MNDMLVHVSRRAMASDFEVRFPSDANPSGTEYAIDALDVVESLEGQISYFRPDSELSKVNLLASANPVEVSPRLFDILTASMRLYEDTDGAYDITATPLWEVWGFAKRAGNVPSETELADARSVIGSHLIELDPAKKTVRFRTAGVRISLGSMGKGVALDLCAERLSSLGMKDYLLHGGQSSVLARGAQSPGGEAWQIGIRNPLKPDRRLASIQLKNRALGTSGGQFQGFRHRGKRYGHILDPRSGWPAQGIFSATVVADTATAADALSTAFYVMGPEKSLEFCQNHPEIGAVLLTPNPRGGELAVHTAGLDQNILSMIDYGEKS